MATYEIPEPEPSRSTGPVADMPAWLLVAEGVLAIVIGFFLIFQPIEALMAVVLLLAIYWLIRSLATLASLLWNRTNWGWRLFIGGAGLIVSLLILQAPLRGAATVSIVFVILIAAYGLIAGTLELFMGLQEQKAGLAVLGAVSIVLGLALLLQPAIGLVLLPWLLGIVAIIGGALTLWVAFSLGREASKASV